MTMRGIRVHRRMVFVYYLYIHCFLFISNFRRVHVLPQPQQARATV